MKKLILLSFRQIARVTGGEWLKLQNLNPAISGVNFYLPYVEPGDLYVHLSRSGKSKPEAPAMVKEARRKGAVAAVVARGVFRELDMPLLEVLNAEKALQDMATASSLLFDGTRILITGSHGKTGFKTQIHHVCQGLRSCLENSCSFC